MIFTCDRKSVEWRAFDPSQQAPQCEVDGCTDNKCEKRSHCKRAAGGNYTCSCQEHGVGGAVDPFCAHCKDGYGGDDCSKKVCDSSPCQNGGVCYGGDDAYQCFCKNGFTGNDCLVYICSSVPCLHDGTCFHDGDGFSCRCADGYSGGHCEVQQFCASSPCVHDGTCKEVPAETRYECACTSGWDGLNCEHNVCEGSPCASQKPVGMKCTPLIGGYNCSCPTGYNTVVPGPKPICEVATQCPELESRSRGRSTEHFIVVPDDQCFTVAASSDCKQRCDIPSTGKQAHHINGIFGLLQNTTAWYRLPTGKTLAEQPPGLRSCATGWPLWLTGWTPEPGESWPVGSGWGVVPLNVTASGSKRWPAFGQPPANAVICRQSGWSHRGATCEAHSTVKLLDCGAFRAVQIPPLVGGCSQALCLA